MISKIGNFFRENSENIQEIHLYIFNMHFTSID